MALIPINLFFKKNKNYGVESGVGSLTFDILLNETHNFSNDVSTHKIENGSEISDHIRNQLENGSFQGVVSNFSIKSRGLTSNRAQDAFDLLTKIWEAKELVTIVTVLRVYKNMAILNINTSRNFDTGESGVFNISFRKADVVSLKTVVLQTEVNVKDMSKTQNRQSSKQIDQGRTVGQ